MTKRGYALGNVAGCAAGATMWAEGGGATWEQTVLPVAMGSLRLSNDGSILTRAQSLDLAIVSLGGI